MTSPTQLLQNWGQGDEQALAELIPALEAELRRIARRCMAGERAGNSLQPTALVNEAYIRLVDTQRVRWQDRAHFLAVAARMMRRVLVDHARAKGYQKRGGDRARVTFDEMQLPGTQRDNDLVSLDEALIALEQEDPRKAKVIDCRYFAGLSVEETASALGVSPDTVMRDWKFAKAWLRREMRKSADDSG